MNDTWSRLCLLCIRPLLRFYAVLTSGRGTVGPVYGGAKFVRDGTTMSLTLAANPRTYDDALRMLERLLSPNDDVIDVGANIGIYACSIAKMIGPHGRVWAIEATPATYLALQKNITLNNSGRIIGFNAALSNRWGTTSIATNKSDDSQNCIADKIGGTGNVVPLAPLDEILCLPPRIALLKLDVEGAEYLVLSGAPATLARTDKVLVEIYEPNLRKFGSSSTQVLEHLSTAGFQLFAWINNSLAPLPKEQDFSACTDVICIRQNSLRLDH
jgi:FkbM family methyltransferase